MRLHYVVKLKICVFLWKF